MLKSSLLNDVWAALRFMLTVNCGRAGASRCAGGALSRGPKRSMKSAIPIVRLGTDQAWTATLSPFTEDGREVRTAA